MEKWAVDAAHSSIEFSVKHMMVSRVKGTFEKFDATVEADVEDMTTATINFTIDVDSINTRNADREGHLKSPDFFDAATYPNITFKSTSITKKSNGEYELTGDMTIRDVTRPETFLVTYEGSGKNPWGQEVAGFTAEGSINRTEYGLKWNNTLETGGVLVGEQVKIHLEIEATKQA